MASKEKSAAADLEGFLRREIPLSRSMEVTVARLDGEGLELAAPLAPNLNHKRTAFGGSLYSLAVLAAWGTVRQILLEGSLKAHVVISEGCLSYLKPVAGEFRARCPRPGAAEEARFRQALSRKGKARLALRCEVRPAGDPAGPAAAVFQGTFAASLDAKPRSASDRGSARGKA